MEVWRPGHLPTHFPQPEPRWEQAKRPAAEACWVGLEGV